MSLRKLSKIAEDQIAREVGKRVQEKHKSKKRRYEAPKKVRAKRQVRFQEREEEEGDSGESSGEEELKAMRC